jgi:CDP-4-dehydro-6-deoxyglucose reductase, E3
LLNIDLDFLKVITLTNGKIFDAPSGVSIVDAALSAGVVLPHSCKVGRCNACRLMVVSGETKAMIDEIGLTDSERAAGWVLGCVRSALTDVTLAAEDLGGVVLPQPKTWPCRISELKRLTRDILVVVLRLPPAADFCYLPGQFIEIIGPNGVRRSYSVASAHSSGNKLELHVRAVPNGVMSDYWFFRAQENDLLRLSGPIGTFFLRQAANIDLVFLATGTGIAPVKAMLEFLVGIEQEHRPKSITVLWGGRSSEDLYFDILSIDAGQDFIPVLSRSEPSWTGHVGYVQDVFISMNRDLSNTVVYACGSDGMISSAKKALVAAGLSPTCFYSDAFVCSATS